nr:unnamed protein product [Callosobruchus chinensis]
MQENSDQPTSSDGSLEEALPSTSQMVYGTINNEIFKAALSKFCQHLWHLPEEITVLSLYDDEVDEQTKANIVANLQRETLYDSLKRYIPSKEDMSDYLYGYYAGCVRMRLSDTPRKRKQTDNINILL